MDPAANPMTSLIAKHRLAAAGLISLGLAMLIWAKEAEDGTRAPASPAAPGPAPAGAQSP